MKCPRCDKPINDGESYCPHCGYKLEKEIKDMDHDRRRCAGWSRAWLCCCTDRLPCVRKQVSETQGELTADPKDALPDQKTIEANKKKTRRNESRKNSRNRKMKKKMRLQFL